jgi:hypothetical protein
MPAGISALGLRPAIQSPRCAGDVALQCSHDEIPMSRLRVIDQLAACKPEPAARFGVTGLALFGSVARDAFRADSDVDILVSFDGPATSQR